MSEQLSYSLTLNQLLINPTGPNSAYFSRRDRIIMDLKQRYAHIMGLVKGKMSFRVYKDVDNYIFIMKVPSETLPNLYYDVAIKFIPVDEQSKDDTTLSNYTLELFSNAPNFTFSYTYVMNKYGILMPELKSRSSNKALTSPPLTKNPVEMLGFEKSCYFAALYIKENRLIFKSQLNQHASKWSKSAIDSIKTDASKMLEYNQAKKKEELRKKTEKAKKTKDANDRAKVRRDIHNEKNKLKRGSQKSSIKATKGKVAKKGK